MNNFLQEKQLRLSADLEGLYRKASEPLAAAYWPGCIAWVSNRPELQEVIDRTEAAVNEAWLGCLVGLVSVDVVKAALVAWYKAYRAAIVAHHQSVAGQAV